MTKIEWTDETKNPIKALNPKGVKGNYCQKVSAGCKKCYAARLNQSSRFGGNGLPYNHRDEFPDLRVKRYNCILPPVVSSDFSCSFSSPEDAANYFVEEHLYKSSRLPYFINIQDEDGENFQFEVDLKLTLVEG